MKDKCYICHETEGILRKTCINTRCTAKTHSFCLEKQYETIKNCGFCKSNIVIKKNFNYKKLIECFFTIFVLITHSYLIFFMIIGQNHINVNVISHNQDITGHLIFLVFTFFNWIIYMSPFNSFNNDVLLKELNNKYGRIFIISSLFILEISYILICHFIGYNLFLFFHNDKCTVYDGRTFVIGVIFSLFSPLIILSIYIIYEYIMPWFLGPLLEPFYDEQFGD